MTTNSNDRLRDLVRDTYGEIATTSSSCCPTGSCGSSVSTPESNYSDEELALLAQGDRLSLGTGNPVQRAMLNKGEVIIDVGSGAGLDCFVAAHRVGPGGHVIGVDMTPEMVRRAQRVTERQDFDNVEFRLGQIENLPVADETADVVVSNCVVNLSPEKSRVFQEMFRVLKPGGRISISDVVTISEPPEEFIDSESARVGCVAGASDVDELTGLIRKAGFVNIKFHPDSDPATKSWHTSAVVLATKPL